MVLYNATNCPRSRETVRREAVALDLASAACTACFAATLAGIPSNLRASSAGSIPLSSAAASAAQPASETCVRSRSRYLSFFSPPVGGGSAPVGGSGATRAAMPSSPNGLRLRPRDTRAGSRRKAGARATSVASPMAAVVRPRISSRGRAPRPRAAASAEAPASPTCVLAKARRVTAGSAPAPNPSASRCTPLGLSAPEYSMMVSTPSTGSTEPSEPSVAKSAAETPLSTHQTIVASRSSLQLRIPILRHNAAAAS
eukprot:scaffold79647_cov59-Phaeocystis_antarctica.AAC.3